MSEPKIPGKVEKRLRLRTLRPDLELLARELVELACAGSRGLWGELTPERMKEDANLRRRFHELAHGEMFAAQEKMADRITSGEPLDFSEQLLFRAIADTIAWGMLGGQLCYARRIYKSHRQPDLSQSNFESVLRVARELREQDPGCMPLITDLTSFPGGRHHERVGGPAHVVHRGQGREAQQAGHGPCDVLRVFWM